MPRKSRGAMSTAGILFFTLRPAGSPLNSYLVGVRPLRVIAIGGLLSFSVEFLQQWLRP